MNAVSIWILDFIVGFIVGHSSSFYGGQTVHAKDTHFKYLKSLSYYLNKKKCSGKKEKKYIYVTVLLNQHLAWYWELK